MERGDEKEEYNITTRQTFIAKVETIKHLSLLSVFLSLNLWILRFSWVASVLTLGLREESRRKIISGGYWGVMQRFNASGISSSCSVPGWQPELGRWEMAATDQWEAETVTRQPIRCQLRDTDSTVQTPETSHQREKLGNIPISSNLASSPNILPDQTSAIHLNSRDSNPFMRVVEDWGQWTLDSQSCTSLTRRDNPWFQQTLASQPAACSHRGAWDEVCFWAYPENRDLSWRTDIVRSFYI